MSVASLAEELKAKAGKPAYVTFTREPRELLEESKRQGHYVAVDVDMVEIRQLGATDSVKFKVEQWLKQNAIEVQHQRMPAEHQDYYQRAYERWKTGQEMPLEGTPIKGWSVISPAVQETLIRLHILTVEDMSTLNDEGLKRIGMGAIDIKNKAKAWLAQAQDKGPLTLKMAALEAENVILKGSLATLEEKFEELKKLVKTQEAIGVERAVASQANLIAAEDIIEDERPKRKRSGNPREE